MHITPKGLLTAGILASATLLGGCYEGGYGSVGLAVGDAPYGYYDGYGSPYGAPYYGYGGGWYNDFYYPGGGYYVYDRYGRRSQWSEAQRAYWYGHRGQGRWEGARGDGGPGWRGNNGRGPQGSEGRGPQGVEGRGWRGRSSVAQGGQAVAPGQQPPARGDGWRGNRGGGRDAQAPHPTRSQGSPGRGRDPNGGQERER